MRVFYRGLEVTGSLDAYMSAKITTDFKAQDVLDLTGVVEGYLKEKLDSLVTPIRIKKAQLDKARPLPSITLKSLREDLNLRWTYNSNAIEGNTLSLIETKVVLEGITIGGKRLEEHLEVINHSNAISYLESLVKEGEQLTEMDIRNIHSLVLKGINDEYAGRYRDRQVLISGASHVPPKPIDVSNAMARFVDTYRNLKGTIEERMAYLHGEFVRIHPFIDGNGRTARLLVNLELMKEGYPPIVILKEDRAEYYNVLDASCATREYWQLSVLLAWKIEEGLDLYLKFI